MRLKNKTIIVTGSTMGIGAATARLAHREGANVLVHGLEKDLGEAIVAELGARAAFYSEDISDPEAPERIVAKAIDAFGQLDGVVNNAAIVPFASLADTDAALFDRTIAINARAPFLMIKAALPHLEKTRGSVVNVGSVNAHCGEPELIPYAAAKGALMTMTRNLGDSLHRNHGVRVNQVNPGWVLTEGEYQRKIDCGLGEDWPETVGRDHAASGRLIKPEEIAEAIIYFLSDACGPISAAVVDLEQHPVIGRLGEKG